MATWEPRNQVATGSQRLGLRIQPAAQLREVHFRSQPPAEVFWNQVTLPQTDGRVKVNRSEFLNGAGQLQVPLSVLLAVGLTVAWQRKKRRELLAAARYAEELAQEFAGSAGIQLLSLSADQKAAHLSGFALLPNVGQHARVWHSAAARPAAECSKAKTAKRSSESSPRWSKARWPTDDGGLVRGR